MNGEELIIDAEAFFVRWIMGCGERTGGIAVVQAYAYLIAYWRRLVICLSIVCN